MEFGPRASVLRSILATLRHDELNSMSRTEFMPFAPVVTETDAARALDITRATPTPAGS
jgi:carbamoyltransferase